MRGNEEWNNQILAITVSGQWPSSPSALPCPYFSTTTWCAKDSHAVPVFNYSPAEHNQCFCRYELIAHEEPRVESFIDKEVQQSSVYVSFKHANPSLCSPVRSFCAVQSRASLCVCTSFKHPNLSTRSLYCCFVYFKAGSATTTRSVCAVLTWAWQCLASMLRRGQRAPSRRTTDITCVLLCSKSRSTSASSEYAAKQTLLSTTHRQGFVNGMVV